MGFLLGASAITGLAETAATAQITATDAFPVVELRQYTLHDGERDTLINLFEREFVESQESLGLKVIGTFTDLDNPNRFVWIRGFTDMNSRAVALSAFYDGPVWKSNRDAANSTMVDSDNVLLLEAPRKSAQFAIPSSRPALGEKVAEGLVTATIYHLKGAPAEAASLFEQEVAPGLARDGASPIAWFLTEEEPNNFPRLPVREGERVLVWFAEFPDDSARAAHRSAFERAATALAPLLQGEAEILRLRPTSRSLIRGLKASSPGDTAMNDFDFLHGSWRVRHRRLKVRGKGSQDWSEFDGTAEIRPLLGGMCNIEEHKFAKDDSSGIALRCFEKSGGHWAIHWVSRRDGLLQPPVRGAFHDGVGEFDGEDVDDGREIRVRYVWRRIDQNSARWDQSFSYDGGATWEKNWIMEFERQYS